MEELFILNNKVAVLDNNSEIGFYWFEETKGTLLRGLGMDLFRSLQAKVGQEPFSRIDLYTADTSIDPEIWDGFLQALQNKEIIVSALKITDQIPTVEVSEYCIALLGHGRMLNKTLEALRAQGFRSFLLEHPLHDDLRILSSDIEYIGIEPFTEQRVQNCNLVVYADDTLNIQLHRRLNSITMKYKVPFLSARIVGSKFEIGPLVLPGHCACFECYWQRIQGWSEEGGIPQWILERAHHFTKTNHSKQREALESIAANYISLECVRMSSRDEVPLSMGRVIFVDVAKGQQRISSLYEVPGCKVCKSVGEGFVV